MEKPLAELILSQSPELWNYLVLRAKYVLSGKVSKKEAENLYSVEYVNILLDSGFVSLDNDNLEFMHGDRWLCDPPKAIEKSKSNKSNRTKQLERIAELAGYPNDYFKNPGRYNKQFNDLLEEFDFDTIETIAYDNRGIGLQAILTRRVFKSLQAKFESESR